jgi:hypothetical protein
MLNYNKFKELLKKHKINLFDDEYRILFNDMRLLDKYCYSENNFKNRNRLADSIQVGGNTNILLSPFYLLGKSLDKSTNSILYEKKLMMILNNLKNNNFSRAKFICNKDYLPKI